MIIKLFVINVPADRVLVTTKLPADTVVKVPRAADRFPMIFVVPKVEFPAENNPFTLTLLKKPFAADKSVPRYQEFQR